MNTDVAERIANRMQTAAAEIAGAVLGKDEVIKLVLASFLAQGHVLIEDVPGVGKTTLAKAVAKAMGCSFSRIQFTPDLLPSDVTGTTVFDQRTCDFDFHHGPIFSNVVLADEINRTTPKTQSALLECMEEMQVTVDGVTRKLPQPFIVIATQNNVEHGSTYPLPEAQLDRFLVRVSVGYPGHDSEVSILDSHLKDNPIDSVKPVLSPEEATALQNDVKEIYLDDSLKSYIVELVEATRKRPDILLGASPRGSLALMKLSRAWAAISGRNYVLPDDIKSIAVPALAHRLIPVEGSWNAEAAERAVKEILSEIAVPVGYERNH